MKQRKIPLRKCVITGEQHPKMDMFRIVRTPEKEIVVDLTGKVRGHGAYLLKDKGVIEKAQKKKTLERHLEAVIPAEIYDQLFLLLGVKH